MFASHLCMLLCLRLRTYHTKSASSSESEDAVLCSEWLVSLYVEKPCKIYIHCVSLSDKNRQCILNLSGHMTVLHHNIYYDNNGPLLS